jgi:hypothetical protein
MDYWRPTAINGTDNVYVQDYASRVLIENGKIKLLREYLNLISSARTLLPNGLADVPAQGSQRRLA